MRMTKVRLVILVGALVSLVGPAVFVPFTPWLVALFVRASHWGVWGPVFLGAFCAVSPVFLMPASIPTLAAGFLFGTWVWSVVTVLGTTLGACAAFLVGRFVARDWVARRIGPQSRLALLDRALAEHGFKIVLLIRLSPVSPFITLNYALGLTRVSLGAYAWGTLIGGVPGTALFVFFGAGLHSLEELVAHAAGRGAAPTTNPFVFRVSLAVTVVATIWLTRVARRALRKAMPPDPQTENDGALRETGPRPPGRGMGKPP